MTARDFQVVVAARVGRALALKLQDMARAEDRPVSSIVRRLLTEKLAE